MFNWPRDGKLLVPGLKNAVESASLLANGDQLPAESGADGVTLRLPAAASDKISSTLVLKIKGVPDIEQAGLTQGADGSLTLPAAEAVPHGTQLRYEGGSNRDCIGFWLGGSGGTLRPTGFANDLGQNSCLYTVGPRD